MGPLRTILVDDNETFLNAASVLISGYRELEIVGLARSAAEAIEKIDLLRPHLVLMDAVMPGMSGLDATRVIKAAPGAPCVVIWTLHTDARYEQAAAFVGADGFVPKSALAKQLLPLVRTLFSLSAN